MRLLILRTPEREGTIYTVSSDDGTLHWDVDLQFLGSLSIWQLTFKTPAETVVEPMLMDSLKFKFSTLAGELRASVREAPFSAMGESVVEDETGKVIGRVRVTGIFGMKLLSPENNTIGELSRHEGHKIPIILSPSKGHLLRHFDLEINEGEPLDNRLIYCVIGRLVAGEYASST